MPEVIFFDAAGTLIYLPRSVGEHYREVALRFGAEMDADRLDRAFRAVWKGMAPRLSNHLPRADDDKNWWRELVKKVLAQVLPPSERSDFDIDGYFEAVYAHFARPGVWSAYPEVFEVLGTLRARGIALGVISNFDRRLYTVFEHLGLTEYFARIIISSEVGADKPDPYIFQRALEMLEVAPADAIHVGDDPERDWGAEASGLRVFRLARPAGSLRGVIEMIDGTCKPAANA